MSRQQHYWLIHIELYPLTNGETDSLQLLASVLTNCSICQMLRIEQ